MNWQRRWNIENYTKCIIPLVFAVVALAQGWVESGVLERAEINNVIYLAAVALLVFIAPNVKRETRKSKTDTTPKL